MEVTNPRYQKQGIHAIASIFTVDKGITKVLLIKRKNEPYNGMWALIGGAIYNDEDLNNGMARELYEKAGIKNIDLSLCDVFGKKDRSPIMRMLAVSYIGVIDIKSVEVLKNTAKTSDCDWFPIDKIPELAYDHNEIIKAALEKLKILISSTNILKALFLDGFTIPEIQKTYETILNEKIDRRNFRRKLLGSGLIIDTKKDVKFEGTKPARLYIFKDKIENKNVF